MSNIKSNTNDIYNLSAGRKKQLNQAKEKAKKQAEIDKFLKEERDRNILARRSKDSFSKNPVLMQGKGPVKKSGFDNPSTANAVPLPLHKGGKDVGDESGSHSLHKGGKDVGGKSGSHSLHNGSDAGGASPTPTTKNGTNVLSSIQSILQNTKPQVNGSFRNVMPQEKEAQRKATSKTLNDYGNEFAKSGFKNDLGIYRSNSKDTYIGKRAVNDIPISDLTDENIAGLVDKGVFDFEKMEKAGLGSLSAYIKTKYMQYNYKLYNSNKEGITDDLARGMKFVSKTIDSAGKSFEGMSRGVVNAGASVVDKFSDNEKIEDFIKNNTVKDDNAYKYEFMPEKQKIAADLIGSSVQILPVITANAFVPGAGLALLGTSIYGNAYSEARKKGATEGQAAFNGLLKAGAEMAIERYVAGGIPFLPKGALTKYTEKAVRLFGNEYMQKFARVLFEAGGEGIEEVLSYFADPLIDKLTKIPGAKIEYDIQEAAYNWLGGFIGSAIFSGGAVIAGYDNSPVPEAYADVNKKINKAKRIAFHNGLNDPKTQKALDDAEKAIKNVSSFNTKTQKYEVPPSVAELITAGKTIRRNPNTLEAQELIEKYSGVGNTKVERNNALKQLLKDKKISRRELAAMDSLAYDLGKNIEFVDIPYSVNGEINKQFYNGMNDKDGRTIKININSKDPLFETVLEESAHAMAEGDGNAFNEMAGILNIVAISDPETFGELHKDIFQRYKGQLSGDDAHDSRLLYEEFSARMLSVILDNPHTLKNLARRNMNAFQKAADSILGFFDSSIKRYKSKDYGQNGIYADAAEKLEEYRGLFSKMFEGELDGYYRGITPKNNNIQNYSIITVEDVKTIQSIGRKSLNKLTEDELDNLEIIAQKYWNGMSEKARIKSPFFRRWYGDWREFDTSVVKVVNVANISDFNAVMDTVRGDFINGDTGWSNITVGRHGIDDTMSHSRRQKVSEKTLSEIKNLIENAILLDSEISDVESSGKKHPQSMLMHKLYSPIKQDGKNYIAKITVEEYMDSGNTRKRFYNLRDIEISPSSVDFISNENPNQIAELGDSITVSDLFKLVKQYDDEFKPVKCSKVLNEDGTPKKVYHGTKSFGFSKFDISKSDDKSTIFLTDSPELASTYSGKEGITKKSDIEEFDYENLSPSELVDALNKLRDTNDEYMKSRYFYASSLFRKDLKHDVELNMKLLRHDINSIRTEETDGIIKARENLIKALDSNNYRGISTPLYTLLHYSDVFRNHEYVRTYAELESNSRLLVKLEMSGDSPKIVCSVHDGYSFDIYELEKAKQILWEKSKLGIYETYLNFKNPLVVNANGKHWNNIREWSGSLIPDIGELGLVNENSSYYLVNKNTGMRIPGAVVPETAATNQLGEIQLISLLREEARDIWAKRTESVKNTRGIAKIAKTWGYDGVIIENVLDSGGYNDKYNDTHANIYIAFDANQIKSSDNLGTFSSWNDDIYHSLPRTNLGNLYNDSTVISNDVLDNSDKLNNISQRLFTQGRKQYGLEPDVVYGEDTLLTQSAIDERLGRSFNIPDENALRAQTDYKDMKNNSLHYSDNVVFTLGDGADISYGTGRIIDFVMRGDSVNAIVSVDSGDVNLTEVEVPADKLIFTSHNDNNTISEDFASSNSMYARAKAAYDSQLLSNNENIKGFTFSDAQYYLTTSSERLRVLTQKISSRHNAYDDGIATSHNLNPSSEDFEFDRYSQYELGLQLYDAVRNYNMARKVSEIYTSRNYEFTGLDEAIDFIHDKDHLFSFKDSVAANGSYMFNDLYRNFERVLGNYYDVLGKPLLDNFDRAKGNYARGIFSKAEEVSSLYERCQIEIGSIEDAAVQMLGEGEVHFDLTNKKHKKLFKEMGFDASLASGDKADISFNMQVCTDIFGEEKALQIKECADYFRAMYDEYLSRANEVISRIYPGQEQRLIHPRKDYFRHFSEIAEGLYGVAQTLAEDIQIDPKLVGKTDRTKPSRSWESIWQERTGKTTDYSAFKGFADYIPHAEYTININPFIKEFREFGQLLADAKAQRGQTDLNSFINYIDKFSNHIAKKTVGFDRILTDFFGRDGRRLLNGLTAANNHIMKNSILLNASVSIKQILNLKNGIIYLQKPSLLVNSTMGLLKAYTSDEKLRAHYESLMDKSDYLAERFLNEHFADRKSGARRLAERTASIGDEFAVRAVWLAAYEDGMRLKCDDAVRYADDIARRCSAGRGIGEKPLAFTQQTSKLILPFLLENNNNWNVLRDAFGSSTKTREGSTHEFSDTNSYSYYKNQKNSKFMSNSFKILMYFLATAGIGELLEELTGSQAEFNPIKDIFSGIKKTAKDNDEFDFEALCDGIGNVSKNLGADFAEHRNFSWVYSALLSYTSDNPLSAKNDFFGSVPVTSALVNPVKKAFKDHDYIGAGLDLTTSFITPYGGSQIKKTINGAVDFFQGGNYKNAPTKQLQNSILRQFDRGGAIRGEKQYEIEKTPGNFARGVLFGQSAFPEAQEYYESRNEGKTVDDEQKKLENDAFTQFRKNAKTPEYDEFFRVWDNSDNNGALPYRYISPTFEFTSESGKEYSVELTEEQVKKYQERYNREAKKKYLEVSKTEEYKKASDTDKAKLLSRAGSNIWKALSDDMQNDAIGEEFVKSYTAKYGEDEIIKAYRRSGYNSDYVPHYEFKPDREFTLNGSKTEFTLSGDEQAKYTELADEEIRKEFSKIVSDPIWRLKDNDKRAAALSKAKKKIADKISEYIKWDYVYKDAMEEFDSEHGEDNPVKKAYEYSHDASVYPYWELDGTVSFTHNKKEVSYELNDEEYAYWSEKINRNLRNNFESFISRGSLKGLSDEQIYKNLCKYKDIIIKNGLKPALKKFVIGKLGV